jgi:hypothetical protein
VAVADQLSFLFPTGKRQGILRTHHWQEHLHSQLAAQCHQGQSIYFAVAGDVNGNATGLGPAGKMHEVPGDSCCRRSLPLRAQGKPARTQFSA